MGTRRGRMTGTDYARYFDQGGRALEAYEREGSPGQAAAAQTAFKYALRFVPADRRGPCW